MKLHLGCGQVYLKGYKNIDFPLDSHTVQQKSVADEFADITKLRYKDGEIEEVRLHHLFEHFPRHIAIALVASWQTWLKMKGRVHIEVPDFDETAKIILDSTQPDRDRKVALRHIFGSNEAPWATHYEGWSKERLSEMLRLFGFKIVDTKQEAYMATRNVIIIAENRSKTLTPEEAEKLARKYLYPFTVNDSPFEKDLLEVWIKEFKKQFKECQAK